MEIKILGMGCSRCDEVLKRTMNALAELNMAADVQKVKDIKEISSYGVLSGFGHRQHGQIPGPHPICRGDQGMDSGGDEVVIMIRKSKLKLIFLLILRLDGYSQCKE